MARLTVAKAMLKVGRTGAEFMLFGIDILAKGKVFVCKLYVIGGFA